MRWMTFGAPALVGLLLAGGVAGMAGCVPTLAPGIATRATLPVTMNGSVAVSLTLPEAYRRVAAQIEDLDRVDLELTGTSTATASFTMTQMGTGLAHTTFTNLTPGSTTLTAIARKADGSELTRSSQTITVVAGQTAAVTLTLSFEDGHTHVSTVIITYLATPLVRSTPEPKPDQAGATLVGTCVGCHQDEQDGWGATAHATHNPSIDCESCHGPGSKHVEPDKTDAERRATITRTPDFSATCVTCHTTQLGQSWPEGGVTDNQVNEGGGGAHPQNPEAALYLQKAGFNYGPVSARSVHNDTTYLRNGCVDCHLPVEENVATSSHTINISLNRAKVLETVCAKCHSTGLQSTDLDAHQAQLGQELKSLEDALVAYREKYAREVLKGSPAARSTDATDLSDLSLNVSVWSDSPLYVTTGTPSVNGEALNYTADLAGRSPHQSTYNRAYWNWRLVQDEKSHGLHAPSYVRTLIDRSYDALLTELTSAN